MPDHLDLLAKDALATIEEGYYDTPSRAAPLRLSLREAILSCRRAPIISEVKFASPSHGRLERRRSPREAAKEMMEGGAVGVSVLTEPKNFDGRLEFLAEVRAEVKLPLLMKDIVLSPVQVEAASRLGADAVLLIQALFDRGYGERDLSAMVELAHAKGLEVLLEVHDGDELRTALKTAPDMIGINNRDLRTLEVDLGVTERLLAGGWAGGRVVVSESGISRPEDIRRLRRCGAHAFLVGTAAMRAPDVRVKVKELVEAL